MRKTFNNTTDEAQILKLMWKINNKLANNEPIGEDEEKFYNNNLGTIQKYYSERSTYWQIQKSIRHVSPQIPSTPIIIG
jgi:hypothetical protein